MARDRDAVTLDVGGRSVRVTHPDKVLYPATGTTKADVVDYYRRIAPHLLRHARGRPATRKRWVDGVGTLESPQQPFFEKNLPRATPEWLDRVSIEHSDGPKDYPLLDHEADLAWLGQLAALEVHVPQWRVDARGREQNPDRLVIDLDPGPGTGLPECVEVAHVARRILRHMGLTTVPVTSGSKGLHLYAGLDGRHDADSVKAVAKRLAEVIVEELPDLAVSQQKRSLREGRVLVDWSQNDAHKTTVAPYSLRGRVEPTVAVPRTWAELDDPHLHHLCLHEVLERMEGRRDPMARLGSSASKPAPSSKVPSPKVPSRRSGTAVVPDPPMLASVGRASDLTGDDWVLEMKWDGIRALAGVDGDAVTLRSRSGEDLARAFPDVVEALAALDLPDVVLDGEIVALDDRGAPSFSRLQGRLGLTGARRVAAAREQIPAELRVFDLLRHAGTDLRKRTYDRRREALAGLDLGEGPVSAPPALDGPLEAVLDESLAQGLEGVVAKKRGSTYRSGRRSRSWIKIKHERTADVVVVGWRPGRGGRAGDLGSLLVAVPEDGELRYAGRVGSGLDARQRDDLRASLRRLERKTAPVEVPADAARDAVWVTPRLPGEVTMTGWTGSGLLRHPVWRGLRLDLVD